MDLSRKGFMFGAAAAAGSTVVGAEKNGDSVSREAIVYVSCHPDDLAGSIGTVMRLAETYDVHIFEYTHGERGLGEEQYRDGSCRKLRTAEDEAVCRAIGVTRLTERRLPDVKHAKKWQISSVRFVRVRLSCIRL